MCDPDGSWMFAACRVVTSVTRALMATDALEIRMARLEGAYAQINERLAGLENRLVAEMSGLRAELKSEMNGLRADIKSETISLRADNTELRRQMATQFYWVLTLILGSILIPFLRDFVR